MAWGALGGVVGDLIASRRNARGPTTVGSDAIENVTNLTP